MDATTTTIERGPLSYCPSCYQDIPADLPVRPVADPLTLCDADLVQLWQLWSQDINFVSWLEPHPDFLDGFMAWLMSAEQKQESWPMAQATVDEFLAAFRRHFLA